MDISNLIKSLENGVCPAELLYKQNPETDEFDWDKVLYNIRYHDPEFYDNKFPTECRQLPAYDKIIDLIVQKNEDNSSLKEIEGILKDSENRVLERNNIIKHYKDDDEVSRR